MNNKGVVLIMVLWVLLVMSLIAWSLSRRSAMEVSLLETYRGKLRSYAAARAGLNTIFDLLQRSSSTKDTLYSPGIAIDQTKSLEDIYGHIETGQNSYAVVEWPAKNYNIGDSKLHLEYGLRDEQGRININAISISNFQILSALLQLQGLSQPDADKLALAVASYAGSGDVRGDNNSFRSLNDSLLKPKNKPYQNILELLEVNGMTREIFDKIKEDVTVYGNAQNGLWINVDTASNNVIQAVANATTRLNPSVVATDIMTEAYTVRDGASGRSFNSDNGVSSISTINDPNWPIVLQEGNSNYYRARVVGVDKDSGARTTIEAVIHQTQGSPGEIVSWQRDLKI